MTRFGDSAGGASVLDISRLAAVSNEIAALGDQTNSAAFVGLQTLGPYAANVAALGVSTNIAALQALTQPDGNGGREIITGFVELSALNQEVAALGDPNRVGFIDAIGNSVLSGTTQLTLDAVGQDIQSVQIVATSIGNINAVATSSGAVLFSALGDTPASGTQYQGLLYDGSNNLTAATVIYEDGPSTTAVIPNYLEVGSSTQYMRVDNVKATIDVPLDVTTISASTFAGDLNVQGDLNVTGTIETVSSTDLHIEDKTVKVAKSATPTATTWDASGLSVDYDPNLTAPSILYRDATVSAGTFTGWEINKATKVQSLVIDTLATTSFDASPTVTAGQIEFDATTYQMAMSALTAANQTAHLTYSSDTPVGAGFTLIIDGGGVGTSLVAHDPAASPATTPITATNSTTNVNGTIAFVNEAPPEHTDLATGKYLVISFIYLGADKWVSSYCTAG